MEKWYTQSMSTTNVELPSSLDQLYISVTELTQRLQEIVAAENSLSSLKKTLAEGQDKAESAKQDINKKAENAPKDAQLRVIDGKKDMSDLSPKLKETEVYVKTAFKEVQANPQIINEIQLQSPESAQVLRSLVKAIPIASINQETSPYLFTIIRKAINGEITNPLDALSQDDLRFLKTVDKTMHQRVVDGLSDAAQKQGVNGEVVKRFKTQEEFILPDISKEKKLNLTIDAAVLELERRDRESRILNFDKDEKRLAAVILNGDHPEVFIEYVNEIRAPIEAAHAHEPLEMISKFVSDGIEQKIVLLFARLYSESDLNPNEQFDRVIEAGFTDSIKSVFERLSTSYNSLRHNIATIEHKIDSGNTAGLDASVVNTLSSLSLYRKVSVEKMQEVEREAKDSEGNPIITFERKKQVKPSVGYTPSSMSDLLKSTLNLVNAERETKEFVHNMTLIFRRPAHGEGGFWGQVAGYAEKMSAVDLDTITLLPDSNLFMSAYRLYSKYIEDEFARVNWIHQPDMFTNTVNDTRSKIENLVRDDLLREFKDLGAEKWRIDRAMTYGLGIARGIMLNEVENAAWADPDIDPTTMAPRYRSYYTNDNAALNALNPVHHFLRWQNDEMILGPLLFTKVKGYKKGFFHWDHREESADMKKFKQSFVNGRKHPKDVKLFIDMLPNFARVGSFITRGGWRIEDAYDGWLKYERDTTDIRTTKLEHVPSWKAIENIGFEVLLDYVNPNTNKLGGDEAFLKGHSPEKRELFKYLYEEYIDRGTHVNIDADLDAELHRLTHKAKETVEDHLKEHPDADKKHTKNELIEIEVSRIFLYNTLFGVMKNRMPTKFIRIDRKRFNENGKSAYDELKGDMNSHFGWSHNAFDDVMKDIMKVETTVRRKVSEEMKAHLRGQTDPQLQNLTLTTPYVVDEVSIRRVLEDHYRGDPAMATKRDNALLLYAAIKSKYFDFNSAEGKKYMDVMGDKIRNRNKHFPFALGTEEVDTGFLAYRTAGQSVFRRAMSDIAGAEKDVFGSLAPFFEQLHHAAINSKEGHSKIAQTITKVKKAIESMHGSYGEEVAAELATLTMAFLTKDTGGGIIDSFTKRSNENSLAAELLGGSDKVAWEMIVKDRDNFISELGRTRTIPNTPYEVKNGPIWNKVDRVINIGGFKFKLGKHWVKRKPDLHNVASELRKQWGATGGHIFMEMLGRYLPMLLMFLLWKFISKSLEEAQGSGKK